MKNAAAILIIFSALLFGTPYLWRTVSDVSGLDEIIGTKNNAYQSFKLLATESGDVNEISALDYVTGCLFAQIPVEYHEEALKAQAVCAYTYALRIARNSELFPDENLKGAQITDSSANCQPYFNEEQAKQYYGEEYDLYYDKVRKAAEYGITRHITYQGEPVYSVYHSVSTGVTNTAYSVWGRDFPYLKSVSSEWDKEHRNFLCTSELAVDAVRVAMLGYNREIVMPIDYSLWFSDYRVNEGGYIETLEAGSGTLSGGDVWRILNLRSTSFVIEYTGTVFRVTTKGYGHGVGMSQYGANSMANRGYPAEDILHYYFTDVKITVNG